VPDDFREYVEPIGRAAPLDGVARGSGMPPVPPGRDAIRGTIQGVRRKQGHKEGDHRLDVSVGGEESTELVIRVPNGAYPGLEGKQVVVYIDD
jgi:hypothetical protein